MRERTQFANNEMVEESSYRNIHDKNHEAVSERSSRILKGFKKTDCINGAKVYNKNREAVSERSSRILKCFKKLTA